MEKGTCFLCKNPEAQIERVNARIDSCNCKICGEYAITNSLKTSPELEDNLCKLSSIAAERKLSGMDNYCLCRDDEYPATPDEVKIPYSVISIKDFLSQYPKTNAEIFDRVLLNLSRCISHPGDEYRFRVEPKNSDIPAENAIFYANNFYQTKQIYSDLEGNGYITVQTGSGILIKITSKGWERIAELESAMAYEKSNTAFVAMWFSDKHTKLLRESIKEAVKKAGYNSEDILVDEKPHNDYIMNQVINMINDARFVIADFTSIPEYEEDNEVKAGVRGGVYFEAGYARGQGKQVIMTCRDNEESKKRRHFDIDQMNTLFWREENGILKVADNDFIGLLTNQILATVGKGPNFGK